MKKFLVVVSALFLMMAAFASAQSQNSVTVKSIQKLDAPLPETPGGTYTHVRIIDSKIVNGVPVIVTAVTLKVPTRDPIALRKISHSETIYVKVGNSKNLRVATFERVSRVHRLSGGQDDVFILKVNKDNGSSRKFGYKLSTDDLFEVVDGEQISVSQPRNIH